MPEKTPKPNPKKETVRIVIPPKPTRAPTIKIPVPGEYLKETVKINPPVEQTAAPEPAPEKARGMKMFGYEAKDDKGKKIKGIIQAPDQNNAIKRLQETNLFPTRVVEVEDKIRNKAEKVEKIRTLKEKIKSIKEQLEANRTAKVENDLLIKDLTEELETAGEETAESSVNALERKLSALESELAKTSKVRFIKRTRLEDDITELELEIRQERQRQERAGKEQEEKEKRDGLERERVEALEKDQTENPFKWFLIDKMSDQAFKLIFGKTKEKISLPELNRAFGESGEKGDASWNFKLISTENSDAVHFTPNGFSLQLQNKEEVKNEKGAIMIDNPNAKYKLINPDWKAENEIALGYKESVELMLKRAREYQKEQLALFESKNKKS